MSIRILLADDQKIVRDGLRGLLETQPDMELVGEADSGRSTIQLVEALNPEVVIMDVSMPELNGIEAAHQIVSTTPNVKVIALSMYSERRFILGMMKAGASGYLLKDCAFDELCKAIRAVHNNKTYLSPGVGTVIAQDFLNHLLDRDLKKYTLMQEQEMEVLLFLANGKTPNQIASKLTIGIERVEKYQQKIINSWMLTS